MAYNNSNNLPNQSAPYDDYNFIPSQQPRHMPMNYAPYMGEETVRGSLYSNNHQPQVNGDYQLYYNNGPAAMLGNNRANLIPSITGFNPHAPVFQPRQSYSQVSHSPSSGYGQDQRGSYNPFGYSSYNRPAAVNHRPAATGPPVYNNPISSYNSFQGGSYRNPQSPAPYSSQFHQLIQDRVWGAGRGNSTSLRQASTSVQGQHLSEFDSEIAAYEAMYSTDGGLGGGDPISIPLSQELIDQINLSPNKQALFEIQVGLEQLVAEPDNYDAWSQPIRDRIIGKEITREDCNTVAWLITEIAILVENCQYNFGKLCQLLNEGMNGFAKESLLPQLLEFHVMSQNSSDYLTTDDRRNLLTFYAELYEKIQVNGSRIPELAQGIIEQITDFLSTPLTDQIIKTVIHALKLCGRYLDADRHDAVDQIFSTFHSMLSSANGVISENALALIKNVIIARGKQWGIIENNINAQSSTFTAYDIVFYDPDGVPVTLNEEELSFFEKCNRIEASSSSQANNDDEEYEEEYEKFLQEQAERTALATATSVLERLSVDEDNLTNVAGDSKKQ